MKRRELFKLGAGVAIVSMGEWRLPAQSQPAPGPAADWYEQSFYLYHLDHHTSGKVAVGAEADPAATDRLLALHRPDVIQTHAKGNPGWTTYPSKTGHTPPQLARDVLGIWRDAARKRGYAWSIYYNLGRDGEIMRRRPQWNRVDAQGQPRDRALCYHSGVMEGYILPMIDEIMADYEPDAFWFDGSCFTVATCYCAKCRERFRREAGLVMPKTFKDPGWDQFKEMHRAIYRECVETLCAHIHKNNPRCRVAVNWAYSLHMPEEPPAGISHLTGDTGNNVDRLSVEAHWYDAQPIPFDLMTTVFVRTKQGEMIPKPRPQMEQEMAIIIANGGRYHAWDNPTPQSGLSEERHEFMGKVVAPFLRERQRYCLGSERVPAVSLLFTSTHHYAAMHNPLVCFPNAAGTSPALTGAADVLTRAHLDYELISRERLLRGDIKTRYLIAEDLAAVREDEVAALRKFVEGGGTLMLTGCGFEHKGLDELCGLRPDKAMPPYLSWTISPEGREHEVDLPLHAAIVQPGVNVETLMGASVGNRGVPLVVRRAVGNGTVLCAMAPLLSKSFVPDAILGPVRKHLFEQFYPREQRPFFSVVAEDFELVLRRLGASYVLHCVNRYPGKREAAEAPHHKWLIREIPGQHGFPVYLRLPSRPRSISVQPLDMMINNWTYEGGVLAFQVPPFEIHQMIVIE